MRGICTGLLFDLPDLAAPRPKVCLYQRMAAMCVTLTQHELALRLLGLTEEQMDAAIEALAAQLDEVTNRISGDVDAIRVREQKLIDLANAATNGQVSAADVVAALSPNVTKLGVIAEALAALGTDPTNPVPAA